MKRPCLPISGGTADFLPPRRAAQGADLPVAALAEASALVERERRAAARAEADVVFEIVEQDLVDALGGVLALIIERVAVDRAAERLGKREIEIELPAVLLELRERGRMSLGKLRTGERLTLPEAAQKREEQLQKLFLRLSAML